MAHSTTDERELQGQEALRARRSAVSAILILLLVLLILLLIAAATERTDIVRFASHAPGVAALLAAA